MPKSDFTTYKKTADCSPEFALVISHLTEQELSQLAWPKTTAVAEQLYSIIIDPSLSAGAIYKNLAALQEKAEELRPHLLLLLHGFKVGAKKFQITQALFETLYFWLEANEAKRLIARIEVVDVKDNCFWMPLSKTQVNSFKHALLNCSDITNAEKSVFKCYVGLEKLYRRLAKFGFFLLSNQIPDAKKRVNITENVQLFERYLDIYDEPKAARAFIKNCKDWQKNSNVVLDEALLRQVTEFFMKKLSGNFESDASIFHQLMMYDTHPLLNYFYDEINEEWYFILLGTQALSAYFRATSVSAKEMIFVFGTIKPLEFVTRWCSQQVRLGNFCPILLDATTHLPVIHGMKIKYPFEISFHDRYHQMILSAMPDFIEKQILQVVTFIRTKTHCEISKEIWTLVDSDFTSIFASEDPVYQLEYVLRYSEGIVNAAMILHVLQNDFYNLPIPDNDPNLEMLNAIKSNFGDFKIFLPKLTAQLKGTNIDLDVALLIYIRMKFNMGDPQRRLDFDRVFLAIVATLSCEFIIDKSIGVNGKVNNNIKTFLSFNNRPKKSFAQITAADIRAPYYAEIYRKTVLGADAPPVAIKIPTQVPFFPFFPF